MASLKDQLFSILPRVLPKTPSEAVNGTELIKMVEPELEYIYAEASLRQHFSLLSQDPTSPIAKVDQGHGYYYRAPAEEETGAGQVDSHEDSGAPEIGDPAGGRSEQREEKFRSLFIRHAELNSEFPLLIEHTRGTRLEKGINKWKFPDVVIVSWDVGDVTDKGFRLAKDLLEVKRSLGEQPFRLTSVELKVELTGSTLREAFFQCVSNSKWAHSAQLVVAFEISDEVIATELRRLGTSYDVSVVSFGLDADFLDSLPGASDLIGLPDDEIEKLRSEIQLTRLAPARERENLDWEHVRDLRKQSPEIRDLFAWIAYCLEKKSPYTVSDWRKVADVEKNYSER